MRAAKARSLKSFVDSIYAGNPSVDAFKARSQVRISGGHDVGRDAPRNSARGWR